MDHRKTQEDRAGRRTISRRTVLGSALGGAALAGLPAPAILARTRAPLRLGLLNSFTGVFSYMANHSLDAMNLFFDSVNWTVAGRKIEVLREDDQLNPQVGLEKLKKLVESDRVDLVLGPQASSVAMAALNYVKQARVFWVDTGAGNDAITWDRYPYLFRTSISSWQLSAPMADWMYAHLAKEIVTIASDYAGGRDVVAEFRRPFLQQGGGIIKEIYPPLDTTDFSVYITQIQSLRPGAVYSFIPGAGTVRFVKAYDQAGLKKTAPLTGFAIIDSVSLPALGQAALGVVTANIYTDTLDNAANREFVAAYRAKTHAWPDLYAEYGFTGARVVYEALKMTDGDAADKDKLAAAMVKVAFNAPRGPFRFDPVTHNPIQNVYICKVEEAGGRLVSQAIATIPNVRDPGRKPG